MMRTTVRPSDTDLTGQLIEEASTRALGWILRQHCELRWTHDTLRVCYVGWNRMACELIHEADAQRVIQELASKLTGRHYAVEVIDVPTREGVPPALQSVPKIVIPPQTAPMPERRAQTTARPSYGELLRDPRWQRKRLEIMQREDFTCQECGAKDVTLNVHHGYYEKGMKPWEYPDDSLHCLCEPCHKDAQATLAAIYRRLGYIRTVEDLAQIDGYLSFRAYNKRGYGPL